ncbi:MAG: hypothetical protein RUMPE_01179 [Eubacteriales bacterium SKADARSKE-1]|nr:hypothetical protein [Eubacteriales bacterium SKADARSKE-1]
MTENELYNFTDKTLREVQLKGLEMLLYFKDFCDANNLLFYLCGGCCIGAIRHKGFIPWDDDIDIFMPRDDYERLAILWNEKADTNKYSYCRPSEKVNYRNLFATINDNNTTFIKTQQADLDINHGLVLDILPLDGYPNSKIKRNIQFFWALTYSIFCAQVAPTNHGKFINVLGKAILKTFKTQKVRYKIWNFAEKQMKKHKISDCDNVTELCSGITYMKNKYPKNIFKEATHKEFEGYNVPIPIGFDEYLKIAFGNYLEMPPKEKQYPHHYVVFCDLNNSYKKYKGKYYFKEETK